MVEAALAKWSESAAKYGFTLGDQAKAGTYAGDVGDVGAPMQDNPQGDEPSGASPKATVPISAKAAQHVDKALSELRAAEQELFGHMSDVEEEVQVLAPVPITTITVKAKAKAVVARY